MGVPGPAFAGVDDAFLKSVFEGERKETESLLQLGADIEARTNKGSTAIIVAAARGHTSLVELLLNQGAKVNAQNRYDDTALLLCATLGDVKCMKWLIAPMELMSTQKTCMVGVLLPGAPDMVTCKHSESWSSKGQISIFALTMALLL